MKVKSFALLLGTIVSLVGSLGTSQVIPLDKSTLAGWEQPRLPAGSGRRTTPGGSLRRRLTTIGDCALAGRAGRTAPSWRNSA